MLVQKPSSNSMIRVSADATTGKTKPMRALPAGSPMTEVKFGWY